MFVVKRSVNKTEINATRAPELMSENKILYTSMSAFETRLLDALAKRSKNSLSSEGLISAAVLAPLFEKDGAPHILLTKRSDQVEHHRGEISFP